MALKRIAIFGKYLTSYDEVMLSGLASGFRQCGMEATHLAHLLNGDVLERFCHHYKPDAIVEVNRGRADLPELPKDILHIAWIQDPPGKGINHRGSDLTYFLCRPETIGYQPDDGAHSGVLYTGIDPETTSEGRLPVESDFSMVGYIPLPTWAINSQMTIGESKAVTMRELAHQFGKSFSPLTGTDHDSVMSLLRQVLKTSFSVELEEIPDWLSNGIENHVVRALDRQALLNMALKVSKSLRIFGGPEWSYWDQFKTYYRHYLTEPADIQKVYRSTRLNLHNNPHGFGIHSRVLECMATGSPIMVNETPQDDQPGGIRSEFEPGEHYIPYTAKGFNDTARRWLRSEAELKALSERASAFVRQRHTWANRAQQILCDLKAA